jgi:hypothetical protein
MRFRFSTLTIVFGLLAIGCGANVYSLITTGQMSFGRRSRPMYERLNPGQAFAPRPGEIVITRQQTPSILPIMIVVTLLFLGATYWSGTNDS